MQRMRTDRRRQILKEAWTGDAVLALYAREMILRAHGDIDGEKAVRLTCNRFLATFGDPSEVEAEIGRVYQEQGLTAAFNWIESRILPVFLQRESRRRPRPHVSPRPAAEPLRSD